MLIEFSAGSPALRGYTQGDDISVVTSSSVAYSGAVEYTHDAQVSATEGLGSIVHSIVVTPGTLGWDGEVTNNTPTVASLSGTTLTSLRDGTAEIVVRGPCGDRHLRLGARTRIGDAYVPGQYKQGSLANHVNSLIRGYVAGKSPSDETVQVYTGSPATANLTPNPNRIAQDIDMSWQEVCHGTSAAPYDYWGGPCSLITTRHALVANHYRPGIGDKCTFRTQAGELRTVGIAGYMGLGTDIGIFYFDSDVTGCAVAKLISADILSNKAPNLDGKPSVPNSPPTGVQAYGFPCFVTYFNQYQTQGLSYRRKLMIADLYGTSYLQGLQIGASSYPADVLREWSVLGHPGAPNHPDNIRDGDSGSAIFIPIMEPGKLAPTCVLLTALWSHGAGPHYGNRVADINTALNTLAGTAQGTYSVQIADLSAFTSFT